MSDINYGSGPFGHYERKQSGHVLNALTHAGVPVHIAEEVTLGGVQITYRGNQFANYRYFDGIEQPLFRFTDHTYNQQKMVIQDDKSLRPEFHLSLSSHGTPGLICDGLEATPELYDFLADIMFCNDIREDRYRLHQDAGAFFQGGHGRPNGGYFYIEFWQFAGAMKFLNYVNQNYHPPK